MADFEAKFLARLCCYLKSYIARHGFNSYIWLTGKMLDLLILKLMFSLMDCMRDFPKIIYTKPPFTNLKWQPYSLKFIIIKSRRLTVLMWGKKRAKATQTIQSSRVSILISLTRSWKYILKIRGLGFRIHTVRLYWTIVIIISLTQHIALN